MNAPNVRMALSLLAGLSGLASGQTITSIGTAAWPGYYGLTSRAEAINADGTAVAASIYLQNNLAAPLVCRWTPSAGLESWCCGWYSTGNAITPDGSKIAGTATVGGWNYYVPARWSPFNTCGQSLGLMAGQFNNGLQSDTVALAIDSTGNKIAGYGTVPGAPFNLGQTLAPFVWTNGGGLQTLPHPPSRYQGVVRAMNPSGATMVGESGWQDGFIYGYHREAAYWDSIGVHQLGWMAAGVDSAAYAVSADGQTIVGQADIQGQGIVVISPGPAHAFRWQGSYQDLGLLPLAPINGWSAARAVSADGSVVLGHALDQGNDQEAFIWRQDLGMTRLEDVLTWLGVNLTGWDLNEVTGISADGTALCGNGTYNGSQSLGWVVRGLTPLCGPLISFQPHDNTICAGEQVCFFVTGYFGVHLPNIQWYRLYNFGEFTIQIPVQNGPQGNGSFVSGANADLFCIQNAQPDDAGQYMALISSGCATVQTQVVNLTVHTLPYFIVPTQLTTWASAHQTLNLSVVVGSAWGETPTYQWVKNNVPLVNGPTCNGMISGVTTPSLTITDLAGIHTDTFGIIVTGECGSISAGAQVIVCPADLDDGTNTGTPDGGVDINDLLYMLAMYEAGDPQADIDDGSATGQPDCGVDLSDLLYFLQWYETGC